MGFMSTVTPTPTNNRLDEIIRQIVREEITNPSVPAVSEPLQPTLKDGIWLLVMVTNVALLLALVPDTILTNSKLGLFLKLVPWLGSSLFVLGYAWFRDGILDLTRRRIFKVLLLAALVILTPLAVSKLRIFRIHPLIEPSTAKVLIDDKPVMTNSDDGINVSLQSHTITIMEDSADDGENADEKKQNKRKFQMSFREVFRAWRDSSYRPRWPLIYDVTVSDQKLVDLIEIRKEGDFDPDFWAQPAPAYGGAEVIRGAEPGLLLFNWTGGDVSLRLPYGRYKLTARRQNCADSEDQTVDVKKGVDSIAFQKDLCPKSGK